MVRERRWEARDGCTAVEEVYDVIEAQPGCGRENLKVIDTNARFFRRKDNAEKNGMAMNSTVCVGRTSASSKK